MLQEIVWPDLTFTHRTRYDWSDSQLTESEHGASMVYLAVDLQLLHACHDVRLVRERVPA